MFFVVIAGIIALAGISYLAISRNSSSTVRLVSLVALAAMVLTIIICVLVVYQASPVAEGPLLPDAIPVEAPPETEKSYLAEMFLIVFFIVLFLVVFVLSMREQRRAKKSAK